MSSSSRLTSGRPHHPGGSAKTGKANKAEVEKAAEKFEEAQFLRKLVHLRDSQEAIQVVFVNYLLKNVLS